MSESFVILLALGASIAFAAVSVGLRVTSRDAVYLLRRPGLLARSFLVMNVIMPLLALWASIAFGLDPAVKVALIVLAMSPLPPFPTVDTVKGDGEGSYAPSLVGVASLFAAIIVPVSVWMLDRLFGVPFHMQASVVARLVVGSVLVPLVVGIAIRQFMPAVANLIAKPMSLGANIVLIGAMIPLTAGAGPAVKTLLGNGTLLAIIGLTLVGLAVGHVLGGPVEEDRPVLALATTSRHPAIAIAIASTSFPGDQLVVAAVLLHLIVGAAISARYISQSERRARVRASMRYVRRPVDRMPGQSTEEPRGHMLSIIINDGALDSSRRNETSDRWR
jgi:BASS family bile acid:Na+ symporter